MKSRIFMLVLLLIFAWAVPSVMADNKFVGVKKCRSCHKKKKTGDQFGKWQKSDHAKAFKTLGSAEAKKAAKKVGVTSAPQKSKECLICHAAPKYDAQGKERQASMFDKKKFNIKDGVQCEVCHGAGDKYKKKKTMKQITKEGGAAKSATAKKTGLIAPDEKLCKRCHVAQITIGGTTYKNPSFKKFNFDKQYKEIAHPAPKK